MSEPRAGVDPGEALARFLDLELPEDRIALYPAQRREDARLMVVDRGAESIAHRRMAELAELVEAGDVWVFNRSRVRPALTELTKPTGGRVELLWLGPSGDGCWRVMGETSKIRREMELTGPGALRVRVASVAGMEAELAVDAGVDLGAWLSRYGRPPLPPYIRKGRRRRGEPSADELDARRYQTVFAREDGSIAAPTAGLHFSDRLLADLRARGARLAEVVLHVGPATFTEVSPEAADRARVPPEHAEIPGETVAAVGAAHERGGRVLAVGTTSLRALEALMPTADGSRTETVTGEADATIGPERPPVWSHGLLTNFHLPRSSLRLLVAGVAGPSLALAAYRAAVEHGGYRFYSYGDAMLIV